MNTYALITNPLTVALAAIVIGLVIILFVILGRRAKQKQFGESNRRGFERMKRDDESRRN